MNWSVIGINYLKANLNQRQKYALNDDQVLETYQLLKQSNIHHALIISTCNRTEFFIPTDKKQLAIELISAQIYKNQVEADLFHCRKDSEATLYFFRICSGLESQIVGDFEILGQVKKSCSLAKKHGMLNGTWERTINNALSAAKKARTETGFYSGASSTSYASIEYLKKGNIDLKKAKYLVLGAGKIGSHTVDHLLKIVPPENVTIANRSLEKASALSERKGLHLLSFDDLANELERFDVLICATNAPEYVIKANAIANNRPYTIVDLSVPLNVDPQLGEREEIDLVNVDELSKMINRNLEKREAEKVHVEQIIDESIQNLNAWYTIKEGMPMLAELKEELADLKKEALSNVEAGNRAHSEEFLNEYTDELFNQLSQQWIKKVRNKAANAD